MTAIEIGLEELEAAAARTQWAERLVELAAFMHVAADRDHAGYTVVGSGRALCGMCEWSMSGRLSDAGEQRSARFALFALGAIGNVLVRAAKELA